MRGTGEGTVNLNSLCCYPEPLCTVLLSKGSWSPSCQPWTNRAKLYPQLSDPPPHLKKAKPTSPKSLYWSDLVQRQRPGARPCTCQQERKQMSLGWPGLCLLWHVYKRLCEDSKNLGVCVYAHVPSHPHIYVYIFQSLLLYLEKV